MDIELLDTNGDVITRLSNVKSPEVGFNAVWKDQFGADSWRGYVPPMEIEPSLMDVVADSLKMIDKVAGDVRMRYITSVPGQESTYLEKFQDATNFITAGYPVDLTNFPWIAADAAATGKTPAESADTIVATRTLWITKGSQIEGERIKGKAEVRLAASVGDAITIRNTTINNLSAM